MSTATPSPTFNIAEPIPGYQTQERIGAGGCGEVWKALAPGGIAKAIKVVFGYHDERAIRELNALNRIKDVRHPFVLSIERIEVIDSHLVIVTELATSSLKNSFQEYRNSGQVGIPREELLNHLRDAADALDYLCLEHSLQHLDVKPENLLLIGGRIKVADFGLVKDLQDVSCSMIGGLTPIYAAPELFDGRPDLHSDQYSLAIVYQEMLTGTPPFDGRTTAQLASQHLHGRPRLDGLPASDQPVIARALSKDPKQRFQSCREMVDRLLGAASSSRPTGPKTSQAAASHYTTPATTAKTEILSPKEIRAGILAAAISEGAMIQPAEPALPVRDLPPIALTPTDVVYRPTIFIGIGGLGAHSLHSLVARLTDRFGDLRSVPALQMLLLDTDAETLKNVTEGDSDVSVSNDAAVLLPLRQPADYRDDSGSHLQWISRRWIYNIPRSLQTMGFRPLGRLAFADHLDRVMDRLIRTIKAAMDPQGLKASSSRTGLPFESGPPRIFIVSSISGGTGSGMALDVAYLVRKILRDQDLSEEGLCGVLAHCASRNPQGRELSVASACAFLNELQYFGDRHHAYPGDPARGLPAFPAGDAPFNHTYVLQVGEDLEHQDFLAAADQIASYLYCNAVTSAAPFFDECRSSEDSNGASPDVGPAVRTFSLRRLGVTYDDVPAGVANDLCRVLVLRWRGAVDPESRNRSTSLSDPAALLALPAVTGLPAEELRADVVLRAKAMGLQLGVIVEQLREVTVREMQNDPDSYLLAMLTQLVNNHASEASGGSGFPLGQRVLDVLDTVIRSLGVLNERSVSLETVLEKQIEEMATAHGKAIRDWVLSLIASPRHRLEKAQLAAELVADHVRDLKREAGETVLARRSDLCALKQSLLSDKANDHGWLRYRGFGARRRLDVDPRLMHYFSLSIEELTYNIVSRLAGLVLGHVASVDDKLRNLAADLNRLGEEFQRSEQPAPNSPAVLDESQQAARKMLAEQIRDRMPQLLEEMERILEDLPRRIGTMNDSDIQGRLPPVLRRIARSVILQALKHISVQEIIYRQRDRQEAPHAIEVDGKAQRLLRACGGARRLLLVAPEGLPHETLLEQFGEKSDEPPTVLFDTDNDVLLCCEAEQLPLSRVAAAVLDRRARIAEVAGRLHTRIDVHWPPLM